MKLTEQQAWLEVARMIRDGEFWSTCNAITSLARRQAFGLPGPTISNTICNRMLGKIQKLLKGRDILFPMGATRRRVALCRKFARECGEARTK